MFRFDTDCFCVKKTQDILANTKYYFSIKKQKNSQLDLVIDVFKRGLNNKNGSLQVCALINFLST